MARIRASLSSVVMLVGAYLAFGFLPVVLASGGGTCGTAISSDRQEFSCLKDCADDDDCVIRGNPSQGQYCICPSQIWSGCCMAAVKWKTGVGYQPVPIGQCTVAAFCEDPGKCTAGFVPNGGGVIGAICVDS